ncbi:MAG: GNAT family N-acetyltransferase [Tetragenococcus koreensis]|nr:GNAT family N-acetyltransferase [Tetragenococcus koreensis]
MVVNQRNTIIAGAGVIENDFHKRKDLEPNICALFVEKDYRNQGIASFILDLICQDFANMGIDRLYLVTDLMNFYERCGWKFVMHVRSEEGVQERLYTTSILDS